MRARVHFMRKQIFFAAGGIIIISLQWIIHFPR